MAEMIPMIALSPTMETGTIMSWHVKDGDSVSTDDILCEVETDKATMDYESTNEGVILKILIPEGGKVSIGTPIAIIGEEGEDIKDLLKETNFESTAFEKEKGQKDSEKTEGYVKAPKVPAATGVTGMIKASPLARKIAQDQGVDIRTLIGSGPGGRIIKRDVETVIAQGKLPETQPTEKPVKTAPGHIIPGEDQIVPVSQKRSIIAKRLAESKFSAPHYYVKISVNMESIVKTRQHFNQTHKVKISMNAFLVKFVAETLKKHPMVNASWQNESIIKFGRVDIALAVAQEDGLITPVVRNAVNKSILEIDGELKILIEKARNNRLQPEEYKNATFTVSNLGSYGIEEFTAIINPPGAAILAVGSIQKLPIVDETGQII
ncbi:MAG: dihydrolipoamide acetyltransferase family protein, partial [Candidatus Anammoxibacter sp.]